ncbi:MAG TPA: M48 family metallopeptidase [Candidatus Magasanikbacteria bacterium]|nr:M48 family metallopeptidase [Candidatus Magasanikbacteria bacterium]
MYNEIASNKRKSVFLMMFFIAFIILIGYIFDLAYGNKNGISGIFIAVIFSLGMTTISYFQGDKIALSTTGAKLVEHDDNKYYYHLVENLCITNGMPMPKLYIIEDQAINAFATGRKPELASIAVTRGALEKLTNEEMEGVLAHELSHIKNYDIRFMMLVAVLVGAIAIMSDIFLRSGFWGGRGKNDREGSSNQLAAIFMVIGIIIAILSPLIAELIKLAVSRQREYLADASGALLTRYPEGLANALQKISEENRPLQKASSATAHLFIASPFSGKKLSAMFSTHPPVEERIKRLRSMGR